MPRVYACEVANNGLGMETTPVNKAAVEEWFKAMNASLKAKELAIQTTQRDKIGPTAVNNRTSRIDLVEFDADCLEQVARFNDCAKH